MTVFIGILGLGFLVFFHELGHYFFARLFGVKVAAFSIGMGPVLLHKTYRGTDYRISLIPVGGYCSMKGESDFREAIEQNLSEIQAGKDSFYGIHPLKRLVIAFAGPFANFFFGFLAYFIIALMGYTYFSAGTKVSMADEIYSGMVSQAHAAGMESGDEILSLDGIKMTDFSSLAEYISGHGDEDIEFEFLRNGEIHTVTVRSILDKKTGAGKVGIVSDPSSVIQREYPKHTLPGATKEGIKKSVEIIRMTFKGISSLFKGVDVTNAVSGPARITTMVGSTVKAGFKTGFHEGVVSTLELLAVISISLFLTNLLPVPVLDGGLILFALAEFVLRRKIHPKILYYIQMSGVFIIAALMIFSIFGDFMYFLGRK